MCVTSDIVVVLTTLTNMSFVVRWPFLLKDNLLESGNRPFHSQLMYSNLLCPFVARLK